MQNPSAKEERDYFDDRAAHDRRLLKREDNRLQSSTDGRPGPGAGAGAAVCGNQWDCGVLNPVSGPVQEPLSAPPSRCAF